ncbi:unnamed protein product [Pylaiella littoralis]
MPSKFIEEQAELLYRSKDPKTVLDNLREKYALSSFPSQMSRVKVEWCRFGDRHERFSGSMETVYRQACSPDSGCSKHAKRELKHYRRDDLVLQLKKRRSARSSSGFSGDENIDKMVAKIPLLPDYMKEYRLSVADKTGASNLARKSLEARSMECIDIRDADALLKRCTRRIKQNSDDPFILAACLSVVSGRRSIEILKSGRFAECGARGPMSCLFSGAAKKKVMCDDCREIPLLIKYKYLKPAVKRVREEIPCGNLTNTQINSRYSHKLGDAAKIITDDLSVRFHDLRCIYGMISHQVFENNCSINIWLKHALMHETLDTSVFYSRCKIGKCETRLGKWEY